MTWSVIALDEKSGALGVAVVTRVVALGALCAHGKGGTGAVALQAMADPALGIEGLSLLSGGREPVAVLEQLLATHPAASRCQLHMIDARGRMAAYTGAKCDQWSGHVSGNRVSVAGTGMSGPAIVEATLQAFEHSIDNLLGARLLRAMRAGEAEQEERPHRASAALRIWGDLPYPVLDLRVDDHHDPLGELSRIYVGVADEFLRHVDLVSRPADADPPAPSSEESGFRGQISGARPYSRI